MYPLPILSHSQAATTWTGQRTFRPVDRYGQETNQDNN